MILQDRYHPGVFSGKWSCCDHRSKHSQGCRESFILQQQPQSAMAVASPPGANGASGGRAVRGPLPPTPMQNLVPSAPPHGAQPSHGSQYTQNTHSPLPTSPRGYESHELSAPSFSSAAGGRGSYHNGPAEAPPPPVPVSVCVCVCVYVYVSVILECFLSVLFSVLSEITR